MQIEPFTPGILYASGKVTPLEKPLDRSTVCRVIGIDAPSLIMIDGGFDLWFDEQAQAKGKPFNAEATRIQHAFYSSFEQQDIYGDAVFQPMSS